MNREEFNVWSDQFSTDIAKYFGGSFQGLIVAVVVLASLKLLFPVDYEWIVCLKAVALWVVMWVFILAISCAYVFVRANNITEY